MGIDYDGGMIVGAMGNEVSEPDDYEYGLSEWLHENDMTYMCKHYNADVEYWVVGYKVPNVAVCDMDDKWLEGIREKARRFKEMFGVDATLFGTQNIT